MKGKIQLADTDALLRSNIVTTSWWIRSMGKTNDFAMAPDVRGFFFERGKTMTKSRHSDARRLNQ